MVNKANDEILKGKLQQIKIYPNQFCVYMHIRDNKVLYVGKGIGVRPFQLTDRSAKYRKMIGNLDDGITVRIYKWCETHQEAYDLEIYLIKSLNPPLNSVVPRKQFADRYDAERLTKPTEE